METWHCCTAMANHKKLDGLKEQKWILSEFWRAASEFKILVELVLLGVGRETVPRFSYGSWQHHAKLCIHLHMAFLPGCFCVPSTLFMGTSIIDDLGPALIWQYLILIPSAKTLFPNNVIFWDLGGHEFWEDTIQPITATNLWNSSFCGISMGSRPVKGHREKQSGPLGSFFIVFFVYFVSSPTEKEVLSGTSNID